MRSKLLVLFLFLSLGLSFARVRYPNPHSAFLNKDWRIQDDGSVKILVSPTLIDDDEKITIAWSGILNASVHDWIGIYCPFQPGFVDVDDFMDWKHAVTDENGNGNTSFHLHNIRCKYGFRFCRGSEAPFIVFAESQTVSFKNPSIPYQGHIALTGNDDEMRIMWTSKYQDVSVVYFGLNSQNLNETSFNHNAKSYRADELCGEPANQTNQQAYRHPGWFHAVVLTKLTPSTTYFYKFGSPKSSGFSDVYSFQSAPIVSQNNGAIFAAYADHDTGGWMQEQRWGQKNDPKDTVRLIKKWINEIDLIVHPGDISYALGVTFIWDFYMHMISKVATTIPYMTSIGNHEYDHLEGSSQDPSGDGLGYHPIQGNYGDDSYGECGVPVARRFLMPNQGDKLGQMKFYYSFEFANVHFVMLSSEHDFSNNSVQYKWLVNDLESVDRSITPFLVVTAHRPMWCSQNCSGCMGNWNSGDWNVSLLMQNSMEELLYQYKVDLFIAGHYHSYQRTCALFQGKCVDDGIVHITVGTAGFAPDYSGQFVQTPWSEKWWFGWGFLLIDTKTNLNEMSISLVDSQNLNATIIDQVVIQRKEFY